MAGTPMKIMLYDPETDEVKAEYTRSFVPWRLLKAAIRLQTELDPQNMNEADVDRLAALVVDVFGDKFTVEELDNGADITDMLAVLQMVTAKARAALPNLKPGQGG